MGGLDSLKLGHDFDFTSRVSIGMVLLCCSWSVDAVVQEVWFLTQQPKLSLYLFRVCIGR
jgi:hypothetical protein